MNHRAAFGLLGAIVFLAGCGGSEGGEATADGSPVASSSARATATADANVCVGSGAHDKHNFSVGCTLCHECGGAYGFTELTLPRGTSTAGGTMDRTATDTTCTVACHGQGTTTPQPVSWNATGPLGCTSCHTAVVPDGNYVSMHAVPLSDPVQERSGCEGCHDLSAHVSGTVRISTGSGSYVEANGTDPELFNPACQGCHDGAGNAIAGRTPPLLVGYDSPTGDFHGSRAGTGYGGSLQSPYSRGQPALPCVTCHETHASPNEYMLGTSVNGMPIPAGVIDTAGVGAQLLCESCHEGARHQTCANCHGVDPMPAGSPCFVCHGHEGIVVWPTPAPVHEVGPPETCTHCHSPGWMPVLEYTPPVIANNGAIDVQVVSDQATISWRTDELATSYVEYGVNGVLDRVVGNSSYTTSHAVTLQGLQELTTYSFRVRTTDRLRNVRLTPVRTFQVASAHAPPAPTLIAQGHVYTCDASVTVTLSWNAVADPDGDPVEYRLVVDDSGAFDSPVADSGWIAGTSRTVTLPAGYPPIYYSWRVMARDAANDLSSPWSVTQSFAAVYDDYGCSGY